MSKTGADIDENGENHTTVRCPYCEQDITGDQVWLMAHGIACRKQLEVRQEQIQNNIQNRFKYDENRNGY